MSTLTMMPVDLGEPSQELVEKISDESGVTPKSVSQLLQHGYIFYYDTVLKLSYWFRNVKTLDDIDLKTHRELSKKFVPWELPTLTGIRTAWIFRDDVRKMSK